MHGVVILTRHALRIIGRASVRAFAPPSIVNACMHEQYSRLAGVKTRGIKAVLQAEGKPGSVWVRIGAIFVTVAMPSQGKRRPGL